MSPIDIVVTRVEGCETPDAAAAWLLDRIGLDDPALSGLRSVRRKGLATTGPLDVFAHKAQAASATWPVGALQSAVESYGEALAAIHGTNVRGTTFALLASMAAAVPAQVRGHVIESNWTFPASLYCAIIAPSGSRKSPTQKAALAPLADLDALERRAARTEKREPRGRIVSTAATEGLQLRMTEVPAGLIYDADELSGMVGTIDRYSGGSRGGSTDAAFFLTTFDGGPFHVSPKTLGSSVDIARTHLTILGGIQPTNLTPLLENLSGDGLMQRFVVMHLDRTESRLRTGIDADAIENYAALVETMARAAGIGGDTVLTLEPLAVDAIFK